MKKTEMELLKARAEGHRLQARRAYASASRCEDENEALYGIRAYEEESIIAKELEYLIEIYEKNTCREIMELVKLEKYNNQYILR